MSSASTSVEAVSKPAAAKKKKKSKKKANGQLPTKTPAVNGVNGEELEEDDDDEEEGDQSPASEDSLHMPSSPPADTVQHADAQPAQNGAQPALREASAEQDVDGEDADDPDTVPSTSSAPDTSRLDAMQQERDNLRAEVTQLRQSLESLQVQHDEEIGVVKKDLESSSQAKESAETQYRNLLGKVNQIRSQLGERLKADAEELERARGRIEELESSTTVAKGENERLQNEISQLNTQSEAQAAEIDGLRNRTTVSTSNWTRERDDLVTQSAAIREEYEVAKQAMQDWEILATEERARREALEEKAQELEDQLNGQRQAYDRVKDEADTQSSTVDGLQRALRDLQEERRKELRELVEQSSAQLADLRKQSQGAEESAAELKQQLADTQKELERAMPFEKEVKEKNLLIGKLRHEAVILNDHLTKALRFLKRGKPEDNVDRQLVTNHLLHFLALDRSDAKKFQILQLIAALLGWSEEQKEQAGLLRQGANNDSLKVPISPFRRTPSTPALSTDFIVDAPSTGKESLAELWSEFLEREAEAGNSAGSRRSSIGRGGRTASLSGVTSPISASGGRQNLEAQGKERQGGVAGPRP